MENRQWNIVTITKAEVYSNNTLQNRIYHKEINSIVDSFDGSMIFLKFFSENLPDLDLAESGNLNRKDVRHYRPSHSRWNQKIYL